MATLGALMAVILEEVMGEDMGESGEELEEE